MKNEIKKYINYIQKKVLYVALLALFLLFFAYIFSSCFRFFLSYLNIDPNFLLAFITVITLILSVIGNKKERKYNFNLNLKSSVEDKAVLLIGKLFAMMNDSQNYSDTIKDIQKSISANKKFVDTNNVSSSEHIKKDRELVGAYVTIYFSQYIRDDWNLMVEKMREIATKCSNLLINYNENFHLIGTENFQNEALSNIGNTIRESETLNKEICDLTGKMKDTLLGIIKKNDDKIKEKYIN